MEVKWMWLVLLVGDLVKAAVSLSTCQTVDMEHVKKRRIEAIRGQILSKLRLTKPPEVESEEMTIPDKVISLYNSTKQMIESWAAREEAEAGLESAEEEYYAKQVHKIEMYKQETPVENNVFHFKFNATQLRESIGNQALLHHAELHMLRKQSPGFNMSVEKRLELQRHTGNSTYRYLESRFLRPADPDEWMSFDVTETVRLWLNNREETEEFMMQPVCSCTQSSGDEKILIEGFTSVRGDMQYMKHKMSTAPYLLITSTPADQVENSHSSRRKRSVDKEYCFKSEVKYCCIRPLYINFRKDLGWKWIHEPKGYHANYCMGPCPYIWTTESPYSKVISLYNQNNPGASVSPCCVPDVLESLPIIYYVGRTAKVEQLSNMIVKSCQCS